jgi:carboxylate-amine ligase
LASAGAPRGLGVVAAGTVPLVDLDGGDISGGARFERMQHEYQVLVNEQHICGAQVHVDVPDRDEAVQVVRRVAPYLPTFLAISASSPYWRGRDTGYASYRNLIWARWPTAGPPGLVETGAEYDQLIQSLITSGTISDPGMVYFDIRPSAHVPTVELRICDACPGPSSAGPARSAPPGCRCRPSATSCCAPPPGAGPAPGWRATSSTRWGWRWSPR